MEYDYKNGKIRVLDIIDSPNENVEVDEIPSNKAFTFKNGFYGYVSSIFVDIRNSTELFKNNRKKSTAKIIRSFTSEIITILNKVPNRREIGIRGDCVYAIYAASNADIDLEIFEAAIYINTYLKMLNTILANKQMPTIEAGIGVSTHQDLVIKAGRESSGVHSKVWIGEAVTFASKLSNKSKKNNFGPILISAEFYNSIINQYIENNSNYKSSWFKQIQDADLGTIYSCTLVKSEFDEWIDGGMK